MTGQVKGILAFVGCFILAGLMMNAIGTANVSHEPGDSGRSAYSAY